MKLKDIMTENPIVFNMETTIGEAAAILRKNHIDGAPVVDLEEKVIGLITKSHIFEAFINDISKETALALLMTKDITTLFEDSPLEKAWETPVGRIPIVDTDGKLKGIITRTDLVKAFINLRDIIATELSKVKELNRELDAIIESCYDGIYITDGEGVTLRINKSYERITGIKAEEVIGRHMRDLVKEGYFSKSVSLLVIEKQEPVTIMHDIKTGKRLLITGSPVRDEKGNIVKVVTIARDITELNQLKEQLERTKELSEMYHRELEHLKEAKLDIQGIVSKSPSMQRVVDLSLKVSQVDSTLLITGESGVGKEVIANLIHSRGPRKNGPMIKVNCASIPDTLLESELFGYNKGAFTGANKEGKPGMAELAHGGTLFLDEIGELPLLLQSKLLRVIQDKEVVRLGGTRPIKIDARIIAATNKSLFTMVAEGKFREDLYYRLNVVPIFIEPLRERKEDIPPLIVSFVNKYNERYKLNKRFTTEALEALVEYRWPGNVRELENVIERLIVMVSEDIIDIKHLPGIIKEGAFTKQGISVSNILPLKDAIKKTEEILITSALREHKTTRGAAKALKVNQSTVVRKAQKYGIKIEQ